MQIKKEQISEWKENPVTEELKKLIQNEIEAIESTPITNTLVYGEPTKTHENLVELEARSSAYSFIADLLDGDWSYFMEEENEQDTGYEQIGYYSER